MDWFHRKDDITVEVMPKRGKVHILRQHTHHSSLALTFRSESFKGQPLLVMFS